jgi:hypothetical protein
LNPIPAREGELANYGLIFYMISVWSPNADGFGSFRTTISYFWPFIDIDFEPSFFASLS